MNGRSKTFRLHSTSPVSLLYSLVETWVNIPKTLQGETEIVLLKDTDVLEKSMTLADYGLPNGDADVSVVVKVDKPPSLGSSSSEDNEKDEAAASASSASESESSREVDYFPFMLGRSDLNEMMFRLMFQRGVMIAE